MDNMSAELTVLIDRFTISIKKSPYAENSLKKNLRKNLRRYIRKCLKSQQSTEISQKPTNTP